VKVPTLEGIISRAYQPIDPLANVNAAHYQMLAMAQSAKAKDVRNDLTALVLTSSRRQSPRHHTFGKRIIKIVSP
jgi:hypothetical protein